MWRTQLQLRSRAADGVFSFFLILFQNIYYLVVSLLHTNHTWSTNPQMLFVPRYSVLLESFETFFIQFWEMRFNTWSQQLNKAQVWRLESDLYYSQYVVFDVVVLPKELVPMFEARARNSKKAQVRPWHISTSRSNIPPHVVCRSSSSCNNAMLLLVYSK